MSLIINTASSVEVSEPKVIETTDLQVTSLFFEFRANFAVIDVSFGFLTKGEFQGKKQQLWILDGNIFQKLAQVNTGKSESLEAVLFTTTEAIVLQIQSDPSFKEDLLANGSLKITDGNSLFGFVGK